MEYPMKHNPGPMATEREQLRWTQQENLRLNQGKDRLEEENRRLESELKETRQKNSKLYSATLDLDAKIRDLQGRLQREASAQTKANLRAEAAEDEARAARAITAKRVELIQKQRDYWRDLYNAAKQNVETPDNQVMPLRRELERANLRYDKLYESNVRLKNIAEQLVRDKNGLSNTAALYKQRAALAENRAKTIKVLFDEKEELRKQKAELWNKIYRQGNKLRQMRDSRNLWKARTKKFQADLRDAETAIGIYQDSLQTRNVVPAEFVAKAEKALMKKVEKAMRKAFEGNKG